MELDSEALREAVHTALRAWTGSVEPSRTLLDDLLLVRERRKSLTESGKVLVEHLAVYHVLLAALDLLAQQDERAAQLLRRRFVDDHTLLMVANRMNVSEHSVSRQQRAAITRLAEVLEEQEAALRNTRSEQLASRLPPSTYSRLFGLEDASIRLLEQLSQDSDPGVLALVGIGGVGKTALADFVTREVIRRFRFDSVIWVRLDLPTMSGAALAPEHALEALLTRLAELLEIRPLPVTLEERLAQVRGRMKAVPYLVVVDNLESGAVADFLLNHLVALASPSKFLLTSRARPTGQTAVLRFELPELSFAAASELLRYHAAEVGVAALARAGEETLQRIYQLTGGNPLALKLVVSLLDLLPLSQILADLERSRPGPIEALYRHIYWQTWQTLSLPARSLLQAMPLVADAGGQPEYLQAISGLEPDRFWPALHELHARSLLEVRGTLEEKRYGVHRLTETFVRTEIVHWPEPGGDRD